jgi:hypothetical protein
MLPIIEAILAGLIVGAANRLLARLEHECPEVHAQMHRDDSGSSTASSGTVEIGHFQ